MHPPHPVRYNTPMHITFVIPCHNEAPTIEDLVAGIFLHVPEAHDTTILIVDDGSTDDTWDIVQKLHKKEPRVQAIRFKHNQGKTEGLRVAFKNLEENCDVVITMDGDLQDDPKEIPRMLEKLQEGHGLVVGWKEKRHDPIHKTLPSKVFNGTLSRVFKLDIHDMNCGYKAMKVQVARQLPLAGDLHRFLPVFTKQMEETVAEIAVEHHPRRFGQSKYGFARFFTGARDAAAVYLLTRPGGEKSLVTQILKRAFRVNFGFIIGLLVGAWLIPFSDTTRMAFVVLAALLALSSILGMRLMQFTHRLASAILHPQDESKVISKSLGLK